MTKGFLGVVNIKYGKRKSCVTKAILVMELEQFIQEQLESHHILLKLGLHMEILLAKQY